MIKSQQLGLLLLAFAAASCSKNGNGTADVINDSVVLTGKIENAPASGLVILEEFREQGPVAVDTFTVTNNAFNEKIKVTEPGFYRLNLYNQQEVVLVLDNENVLISADLANPTGQVKVEGSQDTRYMQELDAIAQEHQQRGLRLQQEFNKAQNESDMARMEALRAEYMQSELKMRQDIKAKIRTMESSVSSVYALRYLNRDEDFHFLDTLATRLKQDIPNSRYVKDFTEGIDKARKLAKGEVAPDIALPNPQGEVKKLSDLRGNVVLVDFWAAWCGPCRRENPNVVRLYEKYNQQGFEVFGVSLDRKKEDWVKAIETDGLRWTQVSDLNYFNSEAAKLYDITAIPSTVLLDREGKIIARNLRGEALENKLAEIFSQSEAK